MDVRSLAKSTLVEIKADDVPNLAAGVAFKIFLAIFPALIAVVAVFSLATSPQDLPRLLDTMGALLPQAAVDLLQQPIQQLVAGGGRPAGFAAAAGVLGGLWAVTSAAATLIKALNRAYEVPEQRKFLRQRAVALLLTLALLATLIGLVLLLVAGRQVQAALLPAALHDTALSSLLTVVRWAGAVLVLMVLFAFVYWIGPNRERPPWQWISPGAAVGVVGWLLAAGGFTLYAQTFGTYNETYGFLAGAVVFMLWLQLSMLMLLTGAEVNSEVEKARAGHPSPDPDDGFPPPAVPASRTTPQ